MKPGRPPRTLEGLIEAFAGKVNKKGHDECWNWLGCKEHSGYGVVGVESKSLKAHRVSWELFFGPIPKGKMVLHKCNNRSCVNPYHLCLGNNSDNQYDSVRAGTHNSIQNRRLYDEDLQQIRELLSSGLAQTQVAKMYKVSHTTIHKIRINPKYPSKGRRN